MHICARPPTLSLTHALAHVRTVPVWLWPRVRTRRSIDAAARSTDGADHLMPFTGDDGSAWLRGRLPGLAKAMFITHWGFQCNDATLLKKPVHCVQAQLGFRAHRSGQDIVLPPLHSPQQLLPRAAWIRDQPAYGPPPAKACRRLSPAPRVTHSHLLFSYLVS